MDLLLALSLMGNLVVGLFMLLCTGMILIILIQKGRGGGLGAAFGGGGAGSLLGTKTGDFLTWVTIALVAGFLVLAVLMGKFMRPSVSTSSLAAPAPAAAEQTIPQGADDAMMETEIPAADATETVDTETDPPADETPAAPADTDREQATDEAAETTE